MEIIVIKVLAQKASHIESQTFVFGMGASYDVKIAALGAIITCSVTSQTSRTSRAQRD